MLERARTETSMLTLVHQWSMDGARDDLGGGFGSPPDIHALVSKRDERAEEPTNTVPAPASPPVLMKSAGDDDWHPLLADAIPA